MEVFTSTPFPGPHCSVSASRFGPQALTQDHSIRWKVPGQSRLTFIKWPGPRAVVVTRMSNWTPGCQGYYRARGYYGPTTRCWRHVFKFDTAAHSFALLTIRRLFIRRRLPLGLLLWFGAARKSQNVLSPILENLVGYSSRPLRVESLP